MSFDHPLTLLLLAPLAAVLVLLLRAYRAAQRDLQRLELLPSHDDTDRARGLAVFRFKRFFDGLLLITGLSSLVLAAAGVRWGEGVVEDPRTGSEVVLLIDLSRSMTAADTPPSRLSHALDAATNLVEALPHTRLALIGFSEQPHLLLPFTDDLLALTQQLDALREPAVALGGSDLERGIDYAARELAGRAGAGRVVVLFSDGESTSGVPGRAATRSRAQAVPLIVYPVGTAQGVPLPAREQAAANDGNAPIITRRNDALLGALARDSGGELIDAGAPGALADAVRAASPGAGNQVTQTFRVEARQRYPLLAMVALMVLLGGQAIRVVRWRDTF